jgi:hypothetical protein
MRFVYIRCMTTLKTYPLQRNRLLDSRVGQKVQQTTL